MKFTFLFLAACITVSNPAFAKNSKVSRKPSSETNCQFEKVRYPPGGPATTVATQPFVHDGLYSATIESMTATSMSEGTLSISHGAGDNSRVLGYSSSNELVIFSDGYYWFANCGSRSLQVYLGVPQFVPGN